jgi:thiol-disulfide isomerase/thioredoxin
MKRFFPLLWFIILACGGFVRCTPEKPRPDQGEAVRSLPEEPAPQVSRAFEEAGLPVLRRPVASVDFSLPLVGKTSLALRDLRGKVVFLNFWATWCGPCRAEMPSMEALYRRFKDEGFEMVAVNCGESETAAASFVEQYRLSFPAALDPSGQVSGVYGIQALPTTYIIDRDGNILSRVVGSLNWNTPELFAAFEALLNS